MKNRKEARFYKKLVEQNKDVVYVYQQFPKRKFIYISPSVTEMFGYTPAELYKNPKSIFKKVHPEDYKELIKKTMGTADYSKPILTRWINDSGEYVYTEDYAKPFYKNEKFIGVRGSVRNISKRKMLEIELEYSSSHDMMTGCYNRNFFDRLFEHFDIEFDRKVGLIICDLNDLKKTNDIYGHKHGDILIQETAAILNRFSKDKIIVCRIGGDEFAILILDRKKRDVLLIQNEMKEAIEEYNSTHRRHQIGISMGYYIVEHSLHQMNHLFSIADQRMYQWKKKMKRKEAMEG